MSSKDLNLGAEVTDPNLISQLENQSSVTDEISSGAQSPGIVSKAFAMEQKLPYMKGITSVALGGTQGLMNLAGGAYNLAAPRKYEVNIPDIEQYAANPAVAKIAEYTVPMGLPAGEIEEGAGFFAPLIKSGLKGALGGAIYANVNPQEDISGTLRSAAFGGILGAGLHGAASAPSMLLSPIKQASNIVNDLKGGLNTNEVNDEILNSAKNTFKPLKEEEARKWQNVQDQADSLNAKVHNLTGITSYARNELNRMDESSALVEPDKQLYEDLQKAASMRPTGNKMSFMSAKKAAETYLDKAQSASASGNNNAARIYYNLRSSLLGGINSNSGQPITGDIERSLSAYTADGEQKGMNLFQSYRDARDFTRRNIIPWQENSPIKKLLNSEEAPKNISSILSNPQFSSITDKLPQSTKDLILYGNLSSGGAIEHGMYGEDVSSAEGLARAYNRMQNNNPGLLNRLASPETQQNLKNLSASSFPLRMISSVSHGMAGGELLKDIFGKYITQENPVLMGSQKLGGLLQNLLTNRSTANRLAQSLTLPLLQLTAPNL